MFIGRYEHHGLIGLGSIDPARGTIVPLAVGTSATNEALGRIGVAALATPLTASPHGAALRLEDVRLLAPVPHPDKIMCLGGNYAAHAREERKEVPRFPNIFAKLPNSIVGSGGLVELPSVDQSIDYEGELCVVIGRQASHLTPENALECVFGYTVANDVSARTWQLRVSQWTVGKSFDTFCPIGPWVATRDEIPDPENLHLRTRVNGRTVQDASTSAMVVSVSETLAYITQAITLEAGDLVLTGTPEGVGHNKVPPVYLQDGDTVEVEIDRIGVLHNTFRRR
jgi:2-keto-4-pentenoate hydratase/2-oxohepta-3-ene-1,7-dioic acid hydratase in catechol pathway